jgi:hypothetical protein
MIRTQMYLTPEQHRALKTEARRSGVSMTEQLRRILEAHFRGAAGLTAVSKERILCFVGLGESGRADTAEHHDSALNEALREKA